MVFVLTFLLIAGLEIAVADNNTPVEPVPEETPETPEDSDMCVGCNAEDKEEVENPPQLEVEIRIDPNTGRVQYIIKGITIE